MALDGYPKTALSPKIHRMVLATDAITGVFDIIKFAGDTQADIVTVNVKLPGETATTSLKQLTGDVLEGPFTYVDVTSITDGTNTEVLVYERASITTD